MTKLIQSMKCTMMADGRGMNVIIYEKLLKEVDCIKHL